MKFSTPVFALVAASAVYANRSEGLINFLKKREVTFDESALQNVSEACGNEMQKYEKLCFLTPSGPNSDEICKQILSDECKNFASNAQSLLPSCIDNPQIMEYINSNMYETNYAIYASTCDKDEAGNLCPLATYMKDAIENGKSFKLTETELKKFMMDTCSSNSCRKSTYDIFKKVSSNLDSYENLSMTSGSYSFTDKYNGNNNINYLNSDECKAMASSGSSLKIGTGLFVSLGLLLLSLY